MGRAYANIRVEGNEEDVRSFLSLCATVSCLCSMGASRRIPVEVDGDGSGDLSFVLVHPEKGAQPIVLAVIPNISAHELDPIFIGG